MRRFVQIAIVAAALSAVGVFYEAYSQYKLEVEKKANLRTDADLGVTSNRHHAHKKHKGHHHGRD